MVKKKNRKIFLKLFFFKFICSNFVFSDPSNIRDQDESEKKEDDEKSEVGELIADIFGESDEEGAVVEVKIVRFFCHTSSETFHFFVH